MYIGKESTKINNKYNKNNKVQNDVIQNMSRLKNEKVLR